MLDCFRTGGANSPETFVTAIAATLARYPDEVVYAVTDPLSGIPANFTFMPTIKDVHDACEVAMRPIRNAQEHERLVAQQFAERRREDEAKANRPTLEELKAKYGKDWGLTSLGKKEAVKAAALTSEQIKHHYQHYDLAYKPKELEEHIDAGFSPGSV